MDEKKEILEEVTPAGGTPSVDSVDSSLKEGAELRLEEENVPQAQPEQINTPEEIPRDWKSEFMELAEAHPEVVGKELDDDIYRAMLSSDKTPLRVYESMMLERYASEIEGLKKEIETLKQNAESAARAPVKASMGTPVQAPVDEFLRGFNAGIA